MYNNQGISFGTGFSWFIPNAKPQDVDSKPYASNTIVKGTKVISGGIGGSIDLSKDNESYNFDLNPHYAQFITNRLLLSGGINLGIGRAWGTQGITTDNGYGINAGIGYYFWVKNRTAWALSAGFDLEKDNIVHELNIEHYNGTSIDGGASLSYFYFLTPFFALNASLNYKRNYEFENEFYNNKTTLYNSHQGELTTSIGLSWFLTKASR